MTNVSATKRFRTRQEFKEKNNPKGKNYIIAIDVGYSGTKVFHENGYFCFPSYARRIETEPSIANADDILYKDLDTGHIYMVGWIAQKMVSSAESNDTDGKMNLRKIYNSEEYKIKCNTAIALALERRSDDRPIHIMTGLPAAYLKDDTKDVKNSYKHPAHFAIKRGIGFWKAYDLALKDDQISVMAQPAGSMTSAFVKNNGEYIGDVMQYLTKNTLVLDIGFKTLDFYGFKNRIEDCVSSEDNKGMYEVLKKTAEKIRQEYNEGISIQALQNNLDSGKFTCVNEDTLSSEEYDLAPILLAESEVVFKEAMQYAKERTQAYRDYNYLIIGGGTGEAWFEKIKEYLSGLKTLKVISANQNCMELPLIYANVRGYYMTEYLAEVAKK